MNDCSNFNIGVGSGVSIHKRGEIRCFILKDDDNISCSLAKVIIYGDTMEWYLVREKLDGIFDGYRLFKVPKPYSIDSDS